MSVADWNSAIVSRLLFIVDRNVVRERVVDFIMCIASHDYELAGRLPLQRAREILTELKRQMAAEGDSHG